MADTSQNLNLKITGLFANPNMLSEAPPGALDIATNVVIDRESIVQSRRGFKVYGDYIADADIRSLFVYNDVLMTHTAGAELFYDNGAGVWTKYDGSYPAPNNLRMRSFQSNKNFYFNTDSGISKLSSIGGTIRDSGAPKALAGDAEVFGTTGWFTGDATVAYRILWGYKDENQNLILGAPSDRILIANATGETRNVRLTFIPPTTVDTTWFYQVYRSAMSASATTVANDDMQLIYENNPTSGEMTAKSITIEDLTPDELKQASLYTNSTQEGIENANWQPPFAKDMCLYKNHAFYANTRTAHRLFINLLASGGTDGVNVNDTVTISDIATGSFELLAASVEDSATNRFKVFTDKTPAENVEATAKSLVKVINQSSNNNSVDAFYTSGYDELPGQILLQKRNLNASAVYVNSSRGSCWSPRVKPTGEDVKSTNDELPNRIFFSKPQQPEAVPLLNYIDVGSSNQPIERILPLRDGIFILKGDGIYRISGTSTSNFTVSPIDTTVKILATESAVVVSNQVFFFSDQGVVAVSDSGARIISRPIENMLSQYTASSNFPNLKDITTGIGYESDKKYMLFLPKTGTDTNARLGYIFNFATGAWTRWEKDITCGIVSPLTNKLYFGCPYISANNRAHVKIERKDFSTTDYNDEEYEVTITNINGLFITVNSAANLRAGDFLYQSGYSNKIASITGDILHLVTTDAYTLSSAKVFRPIPVKISFLVMDADNPGIMKHFRRGSFFFEDTNFNTIDTDFSSDISSSTSTLTLSAPRANQWGSGGWGNIIWGQEEGALKRFDIIIPRENQRCNWLNIKINSSTAFNSFSLNGISLIYNAMSERQR